MATHSSASILLSFLVPLTGVSIAERLRDRGVDVVVCFDDLSKHAKAYRMICLLNGNIPSRSCYPANPPARGGPGGQPTNPPTPPW